MQFHSYGFLFFFPLVLLGVWVFPRRMKNGLLLAMRFPNVRIGGRSRTALVAFAPQSFGSEYQALAGGILC